MFKNVRDDDTTRAALRNETEHKKTQEERKWRKSERGTKKTGEREEIKKINYNNSSLSTGLYLHASRKFGPSFEYSLPS
jgi:hypothetical protein